jgi:hypothetical protein
MTPPPTDLPILDAHIHFGHPNFMPGLIAILDDNRVGKFNLVCTPHRQRLSLVPDALYVKSFHPQRAYVFGGLDISTLFIDRENCGSHFARYIHVLAQMGCDGIKMIEGKPDMRRMLPISPFDSPAYAPFWDEMESAGMPLLWHVNDPEEFWDPQRVPDWARQQGWFYGDGSYIDNEAQYAEVVHVLERHPRLKVIFAHFFFLSAQLPRLADLLDRFPNMSVDLTPGIEMYHNFQADLQASRDFFIKYQDRILFGTDIGAKALLAAPGLGIEPGESRVRVQLVHNFLSQQGPLQLDLADGYLFGKFGGDFRGLALPADVLHRICHLNFERLAGDQPRAVDPGVVIAECERLQAVIPMLAAVSPGGEADLSVAIKMKEHFSSFSFH